MMFVGPPFLQKTLRRVAFFSVYLYIYYLVGGFNPSEKYQSVGKDYPIYEMENNPAMFQSPPTRYLYIILYVTAI
jgi:hypothetical protein